MDPNNLPEPYPDTPPSVPNQEEIVDPTIPEGNKTQVIIKRHPFGIVALYLQAIIGLTVAFALIYFVVPNLLDGENRDKALKLLMLFGLLSAAFTAIFLVVASYIYSKNYWLVTDDSISQVLQSGLFQRQRSELSMANIEDVTAEQHGILAEMFGFGTLKVETAGEKSNFHFIYCPKPDTYAKVILDARERYISGSPMTANRANDILNVRGEYPRK